MQNERSNGSGTDEMVKGGKLVGKKKRLLIGNIWEAGGTVPHITLSKSSSPDTN